VQIGHLLLIVSLLSWVQWHWRHMHMKKTNGYLLSSM